MKSKFEFPCKSNELPPISVKVKSDGTLTDKCKQDIMDRVDLIFYLNYLSNPPIQPTPQRPPGVVTNDRRG